MILIQVVSLASMLALPAVPVLAGRPKAYRGKHRRRWWRRG